MSGIGQLMQLLGAQTALSAPSQAQANPDNGLAPPTDQPQGPVTPREAVNQAGQAASGQLKAGFDKANAVNNQAAANVQDAAKGQRSAARAQGAQDAAVATAQAPEHAKNLGRLDEMERAFAAMHSQTAKAKEEAQNTYMATVQDLKGAHVYSWYDSAPAGAKALGLISQMLAGALQGGFGQSGPSPMDRLIDQNMAEQKLNLDKKADVAQASGNLYSRLSQTFADEVTAEGAFRAIAYNSFAERARLMAASMAPGQVQATLKKALADIDAAAAKNLDGVLARIEQTAKEQGVHESGLTGKFTDLFGDATKLEEGSAAAAAKGKMGVGITGIPGSEHLPAAEFREVKKKYDGMQAVTREGTQLAKLLDGSVSLNGKEVKIRDLPVGSSGGKAAAINQQLAKLTFAIKTLEGLGQISGGDEELVQAAVGLKGGLSAAIANKTPGFSSYAEVAERVRNYIESAKAGLRESAAGYSVGGQALQYGGE